MSIRFETILCLIALIGVLSSCGTKENQGAASTSTSAPAPPPPLTQGISQNLTKNSAAPFYNFDSLGTIPYPAVQKSNQIQGDTDNARSPGWALDVSKNGAAGAVDVVIDGTPYSAHYGLDRPDVASHFNRPDYTKCGFQLVLARGQLSKGPHTLSVRVISSDKKSYNEGPVVQFTVN